MVDVVSLATNVVKGILKRVEEVKTNEEECKLLGTLVEQTLPILEKVEESTLANSEVTQAMNLVHEALKDAESVIENCCNTHIFSSMLYTQPFSLRIRQAREKLSHALHAMSLPSVGMAADIQSDLSDLSSKLSQAELTDRATAAKQISALKEELERIFHQKGPITDTAKNLINEILDTNYMSKDELEQNLEQLRQETEVAKENKDKELESHLDNIILVVSESLGQSGGVPKLTEELRELITCPISAEIMRDPVTLLENGNTYDRSSITKWFESGHRFDPLSNAELACKHFVPCRPMKEVCQVYLQQLGLPLSMPDDIKEEIPKLRLSPGLYEGEGQLEIGTSTIHVTQLLLLEPTGGAITCTLYGRDDVIVTRNGLEISGGEWERSKLFLSFGDSWFHYKGNFDLGEIPQQATIEYKGEVARSTDLTEKHEFTLEYSPMPIGYSYWTRPGILQIEGEYINPADKVVYNTKLVISMELDGSCNGWMWFDSVEPEVLVAGRALEGSWDAEGSITFTAHFPAKRSMLNSDTAPTNAVARFHVTGSISTDQESAIPSFKAFVTKTLEEDETPNEEASYLPLADDVQINYSYVREASIPWYFYHDESLKLFQLSRNFELEEQGYCITTEFCVGYGLIPYYRRTWKREPLHLASASNTVEIVNEIIRKGIDDVDIKDKNGETPLHMAAANNSVDVLRILLDANAYVNARNKNKETPLFVAAKNNALQCAMELLAKGGSHEAPNKAGETPLHVAASSGFVAVVETLLERGAEKERETELDKTAFDVICTNERYEPYDDDTIAQLQDLLKL